MSHISQIITWHGGLALYLIAFAEEIGVPLPAEPWLLAAGVLVANGQLNLFFAILWTTVACVLADAIWFYAGHRGKNRLMRFFARFHGGRFAGPEPTGLRSTVIILWILTAAKFLPLGTLVPLGAGTLGRRLLRFLLLDSLSSVLYAGFYLFLGFFFHNQLNRLAVVMNRLGIAGLLLVLLLSGLYAAYGFVQHRVRLNPPEAAESQTLDSPSKVPIQVLKRN